jgi:hypothetical protein
VEEVDDCAAEEFAPAGEVCASDEGFVEVDFDVLLVDACDCADAAEGDVGVCSGEATAVVGVDDAVAELGVGRVQLEGSADGEDGGEVHDEQVLVELLVLQVADVLASFGQPLVDDFLDLLR